MDPMEVTPKPEHSSSKSEDEFPPNTVDDIPFALFTRLFNSLRSQRAQSRKRHRPGTARRAADDKRAQLTRFWLDLASHTAAGSAALAARPTDGTIIAAHVFAPDQVLKLISLIVPALDPSHTYLGMKEARLADAFTRALDLQTGGEDAVWLSRYKERAFRPRRFHDDATIVDGNLPSVLHAVLRDRCPMQSTLTIGMVWHALDVLASTFRVRNRRIAKSTTKKRAPALQHGEPDDPDERRHDALRTLVTKGTADDVAEIARIILKDVDIRLSVDSFLSWFHPSAKQHYTQIHDIYKLLKDCHDHDFDIGEAAVQVGQYASVMLCMRPTRKNLSAICQKLRGNGAETEQVSESDAGQNKIRPYFIMEPKLDGERLQLHKWKQTSEDGIEEFVVRTYSRKGNDSSAMYASALEEVVMAGVRAQDIILDGEIMIWDDLRATWLPFEDMRDVTTNISKRSVREGVSYSLKYMVFDVLYVDQGSKKVGSSRKKNANMVMRLPLHKRRELLQRLIKKTEKTCCTGAKASIELVPMERGYEEQELTSALQRYETLGYEGAIGKNPDMPYVLAERSLDIAIKLKPDYFDGGIQDLDVAILGAKYSGSRGHREKRSGKLSSFLIGVRASDSDFPGWHGNGQEWEERMRRCKWIPVGSVGTGYSDKDLTELRDTLSGEWRDLDKHNLPDHLEVRPGALTMLAQVAVWVPPWKSVVLTVRAFELNRTLFALRFARVQRVRWDKKWTDCATFGELLDADDNKITATVRPDAADGDDILGGGPAPRSRRAQVFDSDEEAALAAARADGHIVTGGRAARRVIDDGRGADVRGIARVCDALEGTTVLVVAGEAKRKHGVETRVHELGGGFVQTLTAATGIVVVADGRGDGGRSAKEALRRVDEAGRGADVSVLRGGWLDECYAKREWVEPGLRHIVRASEGLKKRLYSEVDRFGDAWGKETTVKSFEECMNSVAEWRRMGGKEEISEQVEQWTKECMVECGLLFDGMVVHAPSTEIEMSGSVGLLRAHGATVVDDVDERDDVTHVVVHSTLQAQWKRQHLSNRAQVVDEIWVLRNLGYSSS